MNNLTYIFQHYFPVLIKSLLVLIILLSSVNTFSQLSGALIPDFRVNDDVGSTDQSSPTISVNQKGNFLINWYDTRNNHVQVFYQRYLFNGQAIGNNTQIGHDTSGPGPSTYLNNGNYIIVWNGRVNGVFYIYCQRFNVDGAPIGNFIRVNDTTLNNTPYLGDIGADSSGNFVIVWTDYRNGSFNEDIYGQRFDSSGTKIGSNFKINDNTNSSSQLAGRLAVNKDGSFIVCWFDNRTGTSIDVFIQRYDKYGFPIGINQRVDDDVTNSWQTNCDVASDGKGYFVVAFSDYREVYNRPHVWMQLYDTNGTKIGVNQKVDENTGQTSAGAPKVSMQEDGKFIIEFIDERYSPPNYSIVFGQRYNKNGVKIAVNFKIPEYLNTVNYGYGSVFLYNLRIYSAWSDNRNSDNDVFCNIKSFNNPDSVLVGFELESKIPVEIKVYPLFPNPFNPILNIWFDLERSQNISLSVYNINGKLIETLINDKLLAGSQQIKWNAINYPSGIYFVLLNNKKGYTNSQKVILLK